MTDKPIPIIMGIPMVFVGIPDTMPKGIITIIRKDGKVAYTINVKTIERIEVK